MSDAEIDLLDPVMVTQYYKTYKDKEGAYPPTELELTTEQLSAWVMTLKSGAIYVDMSVWGPNGDKIMGRIKLSGLILGGDGTWKTVEIVGPENFDMWALGYDVFKVACIMTGTISPSRIDAYARKIHNYYKRYGQKCWGLIYQADVRARRRHAERTRRALAEEHATANAAGGTHPHDPDQPWELVWDRMADDSDFWKREIKVLKSIERH